MTQCHKEVNFKLTASCSYVCVCVCGEVYSLGTSEVSSTVWWSTVKAVPVASRISHIPEALYPLTRTFPVPYTLPPPAAFNIRSQWCWEYGISSCGTMKLGSSLSLLQNQLEGPENWLSSPDIYFCCLWFLEGGHIQKHLPRLM